MMNYTKADLTPKAMQCMVAFINNLALNVDTNQENIYNCIRALRHACVNEDEPDLFNNYYRQFKDRYEESEVWVLLKAKKVGLITNGESVSSDVTHKENIAWLTGVSQDDVNEDGKTDTDTDTDE